MSTTQQQHLDPPVDVDVDHVRGSIDAPRTLVEYGDFQCSYCIAAYPQVRRAEQQLGGELRMVFRHFPLTEMHPLAFDAARAAEAAGAQGKFWEMHDRLFEAEGALEPAALRRYAHEIGVDVARFDIDMGKAGFRDRVAGDRESGERSGVMGTPSFFVHGVLYDGAPDAASLVAAVQER